MISTSYFAKAKQIANPVAITASRPSWFDGPCYSKLAPPKELLYAYKNGEIDDNDYTSLYDEFVLGPLNPKDIYKEITSTFGDDATLLCYEKSDDFCHRHLVSNWFRKAGFDVRELEF